MTPSIYVYVCLKDKVYYILAYTKKQQGNLTSDQKTRVRQLVRQLEEE